MTADYSKLKGVYLNCTLTKNGEPSHTDSLIEHSAAIMRKQGIAVDIVRVADAGLATGVQPDMTQHGHGSDGWPQLWKTVNAADIIVIGTPIWLGQVSSICTQLTERIYAMSAMTNAKGQNIYYNKVGGCLVTGNEDGVKHCSMQVLYSLMHVGCTIPPQADAGWIGEIGPGPSYGDCVEGRDTPAGFDSDFTNRNTTFMTWNLIHMAQMIKDAGGIPAYGNTPKKWQEGERFGFEIKA